MTGHCPTCRCVAATRRVYSYSPVFLIEDIIAVLRMHGVVVEMSHAERGGEPLKAARHMLRALHVHAKAGAYPKNWWLRGSYRNPLATAPEKPAA